MRWVMVAAALASTGASGAERRAPNPLVDALAACLATSDNAQRLACFDAAAAKLVAAERARDVVVVTREDVARTRRSLFGLTVDPDAAIPGGDTAVDRIDHLETTITAATRVGNDQWALTLAEGGRWRTTEAWVNGDPKAGLAVEVRRAALGSYMLRARGQRTVRVMRVN